MNSKMYYITLGAKIDQEKAGYNLISEFIFDWLFFFQLPSYYLRIVPSAEFSNSRMLECQ